MGVGVECPFVKLNASCPYDLVNPHLFLFIDLIKGQRGLDTPELEPLPELEVEVQGDHFS